MVHVLKRLSDAYMGPKHEHISIDGPLSIEHMMPQGWIEHWPLADGSQGLAAAQIEHSPAGDVRAETSERRNTAIQTFGNLTILTQALNAAVSNGSWDVKRPELLKYSLLPINQQLHDVDEWDEEAITKRGQDLLDKALKIWPSPSA
jgi:hypothetical protein